MNTSNLTNHRTSYISFLVDKANSGLFRDHFPHVGYGTFVSFCFGLAEEVQEALGEWDTTPSGSAFQLELGDVCAYAVLIARTFTPDPNVIDNLLFKTLDSNQLPVPPLANLLLTYNGLLKRHFRGDFGCGLWTNEPKQQEFLQTVAALVRYCYSLSSTCSLELVLARNETKLRKRYNLPPT